MKVVREGETVPRGYGVAVRSPLMLWAETYPIPLNLAVRAATWAWRRVKVPRWGQALVDRATTGPGLRVIWDFRALHGIRVLLNGEDVSRQLSGLSIRMRAGELPKVQLDYVGPIGAEMQVGVLTSQTAIGGGDG
jgi:hypothetical protein